MTEEPRATLRIPGRCSWDIGTLPAPPSGNNSAFPKHLPFAPSPFHPCTAELPCHGITDCFGLGRILRIISFQLPAMDREQSSSKEPPCPPERGGCIHLPLEQALPELCLSRSWDLLTAGMRWVWGHHHPGRGTRGCPRQSPQQCPCLPQHRDCSSFSRAHKDPRPSFFQSMENQVWQREPCLPAHWEHWETPQSPPHHYGSSQAPVRRAPALWLLSSGTVNPGLTPLNKDQNPHERDYFSNFLPCLAAWRAHLLGMKHPGISPAIT